jgi:MOSC domain-containing protein YiiM
MSFASLLSVQTGPVAPLGLDGVPSGFVKHTRTGSVHVGMLGLEGDAQADLRVHGGPEKAVYGYAARHYLAWAQDFPDLSNQFTGGSMGENLTIEGMDETDLCVGDIHGVGSALLQVCQPRQPCFKFALRFDNKHMPKAMVSSGRSGWYYRVLAPGSVRAGDHVVLRDRPNPQFAFQRLVAIVYHSRVTEAELARMAVMPGLASQWREWDRQNRED